MKIFDCHSHYMPPEIAKHTAFFKVHWSDYVRQIEIMDEFGIQQSLLLYPTSDAHLNMGGWGNVARIYNEAISEVVKKNSDRFVGAGILPIDRPDLYLTELSKFEDLNLKCISLASSYEKKYLDDETFYPVYEFAVKHNLPIHVHPQILNPIGEERLVDPLLSPVLEYVFDVSVSIGRMMMNGVFLKFPDVKFIFAHFGGVLPLVKERYDNTYQMLRKRNFVKDLGKDPSEYFKHLYFDTSGSKSIASMQCILEITDASHILWGSDFPVNQSLKDSINVMDRLPEGRDKQSILSNNFNNIFSRR